MPNSRSLKLVKLVLKEFNIEMSQRPQPFVFPLWVQWFKPWATITRRLTRVKAWQHLEAAGCDKSSLLSRRAAVLRSTPLLQPVGSLLFMRRLPLCQCGWASVDQGSLRWPRALVGPLQRPVPKKEAQRGLISGCVPPPVFPSSSVCLSQRPSLCVCVAV